MRRDGWADQYDLRGGLPTGVMPPFPKRIKPRERRRRKRIGARKVEARRADIMLAASRYRRSERGERRRNEVSGRILFNSSVFNSLLLHLDRSLTILYTIITVHLGRVFQLEELGSQHRRAVRSTPGLDGFVN